ncbi:MAG: hypothetical protein WCP70_14300 [Methanothrix sp.]
MQMFRELADTNASGRGSRQWTLEELIASGSIYGQGDNSRAYFPRAGAPGPVPGHPVGQGRVGPPAWW